MLLSKLQMAVNDEYDFLNLPDLGADVRSDLTDAAGQPLFSPDYLEDYAGFTLPTVETVAPRPDPLLDEQIGQFLLGTRPFERGLSDTGIVTPEEEETFVEGRLARVRAEAEQLAREIAAANEELATARAEQDVIREQAARERLAALEEQKTRYESQIADLQNRLTAQSEAFAGERSQLESQIANITGARDAALAERDQALADNDVVRAQAAEAQAQALEQQRLELETQYSQQIAQLEGQVTSEQERFQQMQSDLQRQLGNLGYGLTQKDEQISNYQQQIADLQAQIDALQSGSSPSTGSEGGSDKDDDEDDYYYAGTVGAYERQDRERDRGAQMYDDPYRTLDPRAEGIPGGSDPVASGAGTGGAFYGAVPPGGFRPGKGRPNMPAFMYGGLASL